VLAAINTYARPTLRRLDRFGDKAAELGIDAVIIADRRCSTTRRRRTRLAPTLSVQASATSYEAINFCRENSAFSARCYRAC